MSKQVKTGT